MGFVEKNFTLVTSLTQKGKEYFLSKDKSKFNIKFSSEKIFTQYNDF